jgi:hypothetical protein
MDVELERIRRALPATKAVGVNPFLVHSEEVIAAVYLLFGGVGIRALELWVTGNWISDSGARALYPWFHGCLMGKYSGAAFTLSSLEEVRHMICTLIIAVTHRVPFNRHLVHGWVALLSDIWTIADLDESAAVRYFQHCVREIWVGGFTLEPCVPHPRWFVLCLAEEGC